MVDILKLRKMNEEKSEEPESVDSKQKKVESPVTDTPDSTPEQIEDPPEQKAESQPEEPQPAPKAEPSEKAAPADAEKAVAENGEKSPKEASGQQSGDTEQDQNVIDLVVFTLADRLFGVDIIKVQEVVRFTEITRVPNAAEYVLGVMNLRGNITPVIDLHRRFSLQEASWTEKTRIIVLQIKNQAVGFLVDHVSEIMHAFESDIESTSRVHTDIGANYISGVVKVRDSVSMDSTNKLLILLNLENVFEEGSMTLN